jgi:hypothetical protein
MSHYEQLESYLKDHPETRLVIIDPAGAYIGPDVDDYKDSELRALLGPLAQLAARRNVTIILIKHLVRARQTRPSTKSAAQWVTSTQCGPASRSPPNAAPTASSSCP